jgi:hypothetical protein
MAGQILRFVVASHEKQARKAIPLELVDERTAYDPDRYMELLAHVCNSVTGALWICNSG